MTPEQQKYFFAMHSIDEVRAINQRLQYFRYFRDYEVRSSAGDSLDVAIRYQGQKDLLHVLGQLGVTPRVFTERPQKGPLGAWYHKAEFDKFPDIIKGVHLIELPAFTELFETPVSIRYLTDRIIIRPKKRSWEIRESTVVAAEALEPHLAALEDRMIDPPTDTKQYLCAAMYPALFSENSNNQPTATSE